MLWFLLLGLGVSLGSTRVRAFAPAAVHPTAESSALQMSPFLLGDDAAVAFAFPQRTPEAGLHLRRGDTSPVPRVDPPRATTLVLTMGDWSVQYGSRYQRGPNEEVSSPEHDFGVSARFDRVRLGVSASFLAEGRRLRWGEPLETRFFSRARQDVYLVGWGYDADRWQVDASSGVSIDHLEVDDPYRTSGINGYRSGESLRPILSLRLSVERGLGRWTMYAGYRDMTLEETVSRGQSGDLEKRELYGHVLFAGIGGARKIGNLTQLRWSVDYDDTRYPDVRPWQSSEMLTLLRDLGGAIGVERRLASVRWGAPTLLASVRFESGESLIWDKQWSVDPARIRTTQTRRPETRASWGLSAEKWGVRVTTTFLETYLGEYKWSLASLDLSATF
ncbi:MAG: hypothetical protein KDA27_11880 [Candidatus Eisenbacteria bacterium]|uniref:DUF560 domain-containing protein n=1 Tax=Eiseniibacteriota bacterium TaxID=2212470 RepID=A0A956NCL8_UNCEI|nr:hypothetical protein [Candidatus Eisenbacteria bacterium]